MAFAVWIGRLGAALAALLAVLWLWQAQPNPDGPAARTARDECRYAFGSIGRTALGAQMPNTAEMALRYERHCAGIGHAWNQDLVTRALGAGVAAVIILLGTAMAAHVARPQRAAPLPPSPRELAALIAQERETQHRQTGQPISEATARLAVEARLQREGRYDGHA